MNPHLKLVKSWNLTLKWDALVKRVLNLFLGLLGYCARVQCHNIDNREAQRSGCAPRRSQWSHHCINCTLFCKDWVNLLCPCEIWHKSRSVKFLCFDYSPLPSCWGGNFMSTYWQTLGLGMLASSLIVFQWCSLKSSRRCCFTSCIPIG